MGVEGEGWTEAILTKSMGKAQENSLFFLISEYTYSVKYTALLFHSLAPHPSLPPVR